MRGELQAGEAVATAVQATCGGRPDCRFGGRARGGAHREHVGHGCDAGRVEAQRLVECQRALPTLERRACGARRGVGVGGQQAVDDRGGTQRAGEGATADCGARHGEERTTNMPYMVVTLEVFQFDMSALKFVKPPKR